MLPSFVVIIFLLGLQGVLGLKCRSEDGVLDGDLKRVARVCMQRVSENNYRIGYNNNNRPSYGVIRGGGGGGGGGRSRYNDDQYNNNNNNEQNYYNNNRDYPYNNNDRNDYDYMDMDRGWQEPRGDLLWQRNRQRWRSLNRKIGVHNSGNSGGNTGSGSSGNSGGSNANHQNRNSMSSSSSSGHGNNRYNNNSNNNGTTTDSACISLCFFDEMKMLNRDHLPDRQKMNYLITKDLRNRELRNFYTDTIQECFRYMETQHPRDRCLYARELIKCMAEYAKASCDDWEEYESVLFN